MVLTLTELVAAIWFAAIGAFQYFRTDDWVMFLDRWGVLGFDPNSTFWRANIRVSGAFFMAFSLLLFIMFIFGWSHQVLGQKL
ncbi:MAG: hypothetical protein JO277_10645 [Candidatus Eremiobacteraeota bacterium]|nr:hypothetical protein [Candidatus Eremiobacteraeota bacterium]